MSDWREEAGQCPKCGGEPKPGVMYSAPLQVDCRACNHRWSFGGPAIVVLEGDEAIKKRPGMYPVRDVARLIDEIRGDGRAMKMVDELQSELVEIMANIDED